MNNLYIDYKKQIFPNKKLEIQCILIYKGRAIIEILYNMVSDGEVSAKAKSEFCFVNLETEKPIKPLEEIIKMLRDYKDDA